MKKKERSASWQHVKAILSQQSPQELLQLIRDLYALRPEVKDFIHVRFLTSKANVAPYKKTIHQSLYPDVIHGEDMDLARGRKAISDYKKATNDPVGTLELMVYYVECGNQFTVDYGDIDEEFYESLDSMFTQVVKTLQKSDEKTVERFLPRLKAVVRQAESIHTSTLRSGHTISRWWIPLSEPCNATWSNRPRRQPTRCGDCSRKYALSKIGMRTRRGDLSGSSKALRSC